MCDHLFESLEEFDRFEMWAFGRLAGAPDIDMMREWNQRHGELKTFFLGDSMYQSIGIMSRIWIEQGKP